MKHIIEVDVTYVEKAQDYDSATKTKSDKLLDGKQVYSCHYVVREDRELSKGSGRFVSEQVGKKFNSNILLEEGKTYQLEVKLYAMNSTVYPRAVKIISEKETKVVKA